MLPHGCSPWYPLCRAGLCMVWNRRCRQSALLSAHIDASHAAVSYTSNITPSNLPYSYSPHVPSNPPSFLFTLHHSSILHPHLYPASLYSFLSSFSSIPIFVLFSPHCLPPLLYPAFTLLSAALLSLPLLKHDVDLFLTHPWLMSRPKRDWCVCVCACARAFCKWL